MQLLGGESYRRKKIILNLEQGLELFISQLIKYQENVISGKHEEAHKK